MSPDGSNKKRVVRSGSISKSSLRRDGVYCFSPRVVGATRADFFSIESLLASPPFAGKQGEELALAIYNYFTSPIDGTFHFLAPEENLGQPRLRGQVHDPIKYLNAYGCMLCGNHSSLLYAIYTAAGFRARQFGLPGHTVCEVYYEGSWHFLDIDMWTWFRNPAGRIASAYELAKDSQALIVDNTSKSEPCNLPDRDLESYAAMFAAAPVSDVEQRIVTAWPPVKSRRHSMDFQLRPGETVIRSQFAGGCFPFPESWREALSIVVSELPKSAQTGAAAWKGQPRERYAPFRTHGNGRWIYAPKLGSGYADFALGVWTREGLRQDRNGVTGSGTATIRMQSPYPFCGIPDTAANPIRHHDGVWLEIAGADAATFEVDNAEGAWAKVFESTGQGAFKQRLDITQLLAQRYDCLIRFTLGEQARLDTLSFDGAILTAPMSLPRLVRGANRMELRCLDKHHLCTAPWTRIVDFRASADLTAQIENGVAKPSVKGWQKLAPCDASQPVRAVFRMDAPGARKYAWFWVLATVDEPPADQGPKSALLEWSLDGQKWAPFAAQGIGNSDVQWDVSLDGEVLLAPDSAACVWLRLTSDTAIARLEFYGHLDLGDANSSALRITHRWTEESQTRQFVAPSGCSIYELTCGRNPSGHTIEMSLPSKVVAGSYSTMALKNLTAPSVALV